MSLVTPSEEFALLLFVLSVAAGLFGWLVRSFVASLRDDIRENTGAITKLTDALGHLVERVARLEGPKRRY